jgi:hypothetical protein
MDYTQQGVLNVQRRVHDRLRSLCATKNILLDPASPMWFDGSSALPTPGRAWKLTLSSHGYLATLEFTPLELDNFLADDLREVVTQRLSRALDSLRPKK